MGNDGTFSVIRARRDGRDAIIVLDTALDRGRLLQSFPWLVTIALPIRRPNRFGLCDDVESARLGDIEDGLLAALDEEAYRYAGRITWNGKREVLIYAADADDALQRLRALATKLNEMVELSKEHEADWDTYRRLVKGIR